MTEPSVEEIVTSIEKRLNYSGTLGHIDPEYLRYFIASWRERGERVAELQAEVGYSDSIRAVARKQALEEAEAEARRYVHEPDKQTNQFYEGMTYAKETIVARISALAGKGEP